MKGSIMGEARVLQNFVGGEYRPTSGERIDVVSPVTGEVVATSPLSSATEVSDAYAAAAAAFEESVADLIDRYEAATAGLPRTERTSLEMVI